MTFVFLLLLQALKFFTYRIVHWGVSADIWVDKRIYRQLREVSSIEGAEEWQDAIWEELEDEDREELDGPRHLQELRKQEWKDS